MTCYVGALPIAASAMCPPGQLLNKGSKTCTSPPTASELCPQSLLLRDNEVVTVAQQSVAVPRTLTCSQSNLRPFEPWMVSEHCTNFELCNSYGQYKETRMLCGNFYQCARTREGRWVSEMWQCFGDTLYSYQHDRCVSKPTADELCVGSSGK
ncbi:uncharacterized protein [Procambarus clarkii]|uniref:uncharacterized protein n=1 Tax=Procambarus clarkii TaxID=6728 RepID=UPI001E67067C|nr:uncharacterized protein LOC123769411 [Procambarus clarkii]